MSEPTPEATPPTTAAPAPLASPATEAKPDHRNMYRAAGIVGFFTILSRILGVFRDWLMARTFGASAINDAFQFAFLLPNLPRRLLGEGALAQSFIPVMTHQLAENKKDQAFRTASIVLTRVAWMLFLVCGGIILLSIALRHLGVPEMLGNALHLKPDTPYEIGLTMKLSEIMIAYCVLINAAAGLMSILNALGHFAMPAFGPVLLNVLMILGCTLYLNVLGSTKEDQIHVISWAVLLGGAAQLLVLVPPAIWKGFKYRPSLDKTDEGYQEIMQNFKPVIWGMAVFQINVLLDQVIARTFIHEDGPVTMLAYGQRLIQLPWAIFSLSVATAALPMLSRYWADGKKEEFAQAIGSAVRNTLYLAAPAAIGLCLLSKDLVRLFYGSGAFLQNDGEAVNRTARVVFCLALGLIFLSLNTLLARALYATKDTKTPSKAAVRAVIVNIILNLMLVNTGLKEAGLALASTISAAYQTYYLSGALRKQLPEVKSGRLFWFIVLYFIGIVGGVFAAAVSDGFFNKSNDMHVLLSFIVKVVLVAMGLYLPLDWFFSRELAPVRLEKDENNEELRYGVPEEKWPRDLIFYHAIFTITLAGALMGILVWVVRDSLPPEGHTFMLVLQRAVVPVLVGGLVYWMGSSMFQSREYEEMKRAVFRKKA